MEIDRENISNFTDDELFKTMKKCGLNVGPINKSTRSVYEKRLRNYLDGNTTISADLTTIPKEPVAVLTAASLNETFPRARPEQKREEPKQVVQPQPIVKKNPEPKQTTLDDAVTRSTFVRPSEPAPRNTQLQTNGFSSSNNIPTVAAATTTITASSRLSYEPLAKSVERKSNELDFKLIKPTITTNSYAPMSNTPTRRDINYGLLDDKQTPTTLSSSYRLPDSTASVTASNLRTRVTNVANTNTNRMETQPVKPTTTSTTKTSEVNSKGKSSFRWKYYLLILILFGFIYFGAISFNSNPENPVEFMN